MLLLFLAMQSIQDENDRAFIETIYRQYRPIMMKKALELCGNPNMAEDAVQDACIRLIGRIETLKLLDSRALVVYLVYTVRSTALDLLDKEHRLEKKRMDVSEMETVRDAARSIEELIEQAENFDQVKSVVDGLSEERRILFTCKYYYDLSNREIAELLHQSPQNIHGKLKRLLNRIRRHLTRGKVSK